MNTFALERGGQPPAAALRNPLTPWYSPKTTTAYSGTSLYFGEVVRTQTVVHNATKGRCWDGYEPTPGSKPYEDGSCQKVGSSKKKKKKKKMATSRENASAVRGKGGIHPRGSDADGDGRTGEGKHSKADWKKDSDGDGKPDPVDASSSEYDSEYESTSEDEKQSKGNGMATKRANASVGADECACPIQLAKKARAIAEAAKATLES